MNYRKLSTLFLLVTPAIHAVTLTDDGLNKLTIGGWLDARVLSTPEQDELNSGASRINFNFEHRLSNQWSAQAKFEWGVNPVGSSKLVYSYNNNFSVKSGNFLNNRLGFVAAKHPKYGSILLGKNWSVWYDVVGDTNIQKVWDGNASGTYTFQSDGGINGAGRPNNAIQYRIGLGKFELALQTQVASQDAQTVDIITGLNGSGLNSVDLSNSPAAVKSITIENGLGFSAKYQLSPDLKLLIGGLASKFKATANDPLYNDADTSYIYGASATYGRNWNNPGHYFSANVSKQHFHDVDNIGRILENAFGTELLYSYTLPSRIRLMGAFNYLNADNNIDTPLNRVRSFKRQNIVLGVHYLWSSVFNVYVEGRKDFSKFGGYTEQESANNKFDSDGFAVGMRYYL